MNRTVTVLAVLAAAATASSCNTMGRALGMEKVTPDEFRVVTRAPLTVPPDYSLRPPRPGEPRPQELAPDEEARQALLFGQDVGRNASPGERTLVSRAGADAVDPNIRDTVDFEGANIVHRNEAFSDRVNAGATAQTPEQQQAEAEAVRRATGGGSVVIEREAGSDKLPGT